MTHASFCSGIDGAAVAASWLGWDHAFYGEINEFSLRVLRYYYPHAKEYNDIRKADVTEWRGKIDVLTIGFPCQPFSVAGRRSGEDHDSYLWPETLRIVEQCRPRWFIGENVDGISSMVFPGVETSMGEKRDLFGEGNTVYERIDEYTIERICADIESIGYEVYPVFLPACSVGAPHKRMRCFFIAYTTDTGSKNMCRQNEQANSLKQTTYSHSFGLEKERAKKWAERSTRSYLQNNWRNFPTQSPVCSGDDGVPGELSDITFPKWRRESVAALGNAIVPPLIYQIYKLIDEIETN